MLQGYEVILFGCLWSLRLFSQISRHKDTNLFAMKQLNRTKSEDNRP